ncbi:hypothetical protein GF362_03490 [Candidatus Dojkabacteria bacterium]|nr:hypothetical protein [Candidatus Dojkabacteria bacterium]
MVKKKGKIIFIFILTCFIFVGCKTSDQIESGMSAVGDLNNSTETLKVKTELQSIQKQIETYYLQSSKYPQSLSTIGVENNILGEEVIYRQDEQKGYILKIKLSNGEVYSLSGKNVESDTKINEIEDASNQFDNSLTKDIK